MSVKGLGDIEVEKHDDCIALVVRTTARFWKWDAFVIVENERVGDYRPTKDRTYGAPGFRGVRGLERFYIDDITYWAKKVGTYRSEVKAYKKAVKAMRKFVKWRYQQIEVERQMEKS